MTVKKLLTFPVCTECETRGVTLTLLGAKKKADIKRLSEKNMELSAVFTPMLNFPHRTMSSMEEKNYLARHTDTMCWSKPYCQCITSHSLS